MSLRVARILDPSWSEVERRTAPPLKQSIPVYIREGSLGSLVTAPIIYSLVVPFALLDVWTSVYQWAFGRPLALQAVPGLRRFHCCWCRQWLSFRSRLRFRMRHSRRYSVSCLFRVCSLE
jgi:hypothetical protein